MDTDEEYEREVQFDRTQPITHEQNKPTWHYEDAYITSDAVTAQNRLMFENLFP